MASGFLRLLDERIGDPQLDERLSRHADACCFAINRGKQIDRKVDVHPLDLARGTAGLESSM
jgi:hypothetical protein